MKFVLFACLAVGAMAQSVQQSVQQSQQPQQFKQLPPAQEVNPIRQYKVSSDIQAPKEVTLISGLQPAFQSQQIQQNPQSVSQNPQQHQGFQQNTPPHFQTSQETQQSAEFRPISQPQFNAVQSVQPLSNLQPNSQFPGAQTQVQASQTQTAQEVRPIVPHPPSFQIRQNTQVKRSNQPVAILTKTEENNSQGDFHSYVELTDGTVQENIGTQAKEGGTVMKGQYSYTSKEGIPIKMSYTADGNGVVFIGDHIPTPPTQG